MNRLTSKVTLLPKRTFMLDCNMRCIQMGRFLLESKLQFSTQPSTLPSQEPSVSQPGQQQASTPTIDKSFKDQMYTDPVKFTTSLNSTALAPDP